MTGINQGKNVILLPRYLETYFNKLGFHNIKGEISFLGES